VSNNDKIEPINDVINRLPEALENGHGETLDWFVTYMRSLDLAGEYGRFDEVAALCEGAGYSADYKFSGDEDDGAMPDVVARSIVAHAISCMKEGASPLSIIAEQVDVYYQEVAYQQKLSGEDSPAPEPE